MYELISHQVDFFKSTTRHTALVGGFGCGKTFIGILKTVQKKLENPAINVGYYLPTYPLIKDIGFPNFKNILNNHGVRFVLNEQDKTFKTAYGNIMLRSMDDPNYIVGYETGYALIDEADRVPRRKMDEAFINILARNRAVTPSGKNQTDFVSTPEGFGFLYDFFIEKPSENKLLIKGSTLSNPNLSETYIEALKEVYTPQQLQAYLNGDFVNFTSFSVFSNFDRQRNNSDRTIRPNDQLHIGLDFNIGQMSAVIHVKDGDKITAVDEITGVYDTQVMARILKDRYNGMKLTIYPDASGGSRKTVGGSDFDILRDEGFTVVSGKSNPLVKDRITTANAGFLNGKGISTYFVNVISCPNYTRTLEQLSYKNGEPDKGSGLDHIADAGTYAFYNLKKLSLNFDKINL